MLCQTGMILLLFDDNWIIDNIHRYIKKKIYNKVYFLSVLQQKSVHEENDGTGTLKGDEYVYTTLAVSQVFFFSRLI